MDIVEKIDNQINNLSEGKIIDGIKSLASLFVEFFSTGGDLLQLSRWLKLAIKHAISIQRLGIEKKKRIKEKVSDWSKRLKWATENPENLKDIEKILMDMYKEAKKEKDPDVSKSLIDYVQYLTQTANRVLAREIEREERPVIYEGFASDLKKITSSLTTDPVDFEKENLLTLSMKRSRREVLQRVLRNINELMEDVGEESEKHLVNKLESMLEKLKRISRIDQHIEVRRDANKYLQLIINTMEKSDIFLRV